MRLDCDSDGGGGHRARLGLIVLHVDETVEGEFRRLVDVDGVALHCTRVRSGTELTPGSIEAMAARLPAAAALLPPAAAFDVIGYACTSGATLIGPERAAGLIRSGRSGDAVGAAAAPTAITDPLTATRSAGRARGLQRIGVVSPYIARGSAPMRAALEADGPAVAASGSFEQAEEHAVARIATASVLAAIERVAGAAPCDGVFVSCTNLRTLDVLPVAEERLGIPVISSNQALAWHMLRSAGVTDALPGLGSLLRV